MPSGKLKKPELALIIAIGSAVRLCAVLLVGCIILRSAVLIARSAPQAVDTSKYGEYTLYLQALGSPDWPFGPQDGRVVLKKDGRTVAEEDFELHNDGKNMNGGNWTVHWNGSGVTAIISGEEQDDMIIRFYF